MLRCPAAAFDCVLVLLSIAPPGQTDGACHSEATNVYLSGGSHCLDLMQVTRPCRLQSPPITRVNNS